jgi:hypothetical protein
MYGSYNTNTQHIGMINFLKIFEIFFFEKVSKKFKNDGLLNFEVFLVKSLRFFVFTRKITQNYCFVDLLTFDVLY